MSAKAPAPKPATSGPRPELLTIAEVCSWLRIGRNTAAELVRSGEIHGVRIGHSYRISRDSVQRLLEGGAAEAGR